jgi:hypothetical protein
MGQQVAHPAQQELRQHRTCLAALIKAVTRHAETISRGSGARSARVSDAARKAARAR